MRGVSYAILTRMSDSFAQAPPARSCNPGRQPALRKSDRLHLRWRTDVVVTADWTRRPGNDVAAPRPRKRLLPTGQVPYRSKVEALQLERRGNVVRTATRSPVRRSPVRDPN